jgi:acylphosphatase
MVTNSSPDALICRGFTVTGRVQGVGFRASTVDAAQQCGVTGWVRNRDDGDVEGAAYGNPEQLAEFTAFLNHGPAPAAVESVDYFDVPMNAALSLGGAPTTTFSIR